MLRYTLFSNGCAGHRRFREASHKDAPCTGTASYVIKIGQEAENNYVPTITENTKYQYKVKINGADEDFETIVWNKYISNLKQSESFYKYDDTSDDATFKRQIDKIYKNNLENAKLNKFQSHYENSFGVEYNADIQEYVVNEKTYKYIMYIVFDAQLDIKLMLNALRYK